MEQGMKAETIKRAMGAAFEVTGINGVLLRSQAALLRPFARAVYYHDVPPSAADRFEAHVRCYARYFDPVDEQGLRDLLTGRTRAKRPGLLITFDDGLRSCAEVVAPILEKYGFTGWFFIPAGLPGLSEDEQPMAARNAHIVYSPEYGDSRVFMTWDQICALAGRHVVGCHTMNHTWLKNGLSDDVLRYEIIESGRVLGERLHAPIRFFCWVGGQEWAYSAAAARVIRDAGYEFCFTTNNSMIRPGTDPMALNRHNAEAGFPLSLIKFHLSGFMDLYYAGQRRRVHKSLNLNSSE